MSVSGRSRHDSDDRLGCVFGRGAGGFHRDRRTWRIASIHAVKSLRSWRRRSSDRSLPNAARLGSRSRRSCSSTDTVKATKITLPLAASTSAWTRSAKSGATVGSGTKVKIRDRPSLAASVTI